MLVICRNAEKLLQPTNGIGAGRELMGLIVTPPIEKRKEKWMTEVSERLIDLENSQKVNLKELQENPQFIDTVIQATSYALKSSEKEKINAFQNAIINTALNEVPELTISHIFLNLIDSYTSWHIKILDLFDDPAEWFKRNNRQIQSAEPPRSCTRNCVTSLICDGCRGAMGSRR